PPAELLEDRVNQAEQLIEDTHARWSFLLSNLDTPLRDAKDRMQALGVQALNGTFDERLAKQPDATVFDIVQVRIVSVSWTSEVAATPRLFCGSSAFRLILAGAAAINTRVLRGRVFVALHMHAGDGNVHTNIPVNSDHYQMLLDAHATVARIM